MEVGIEIGVSVGIKVGVEVGIEIGVSVGTKVGVGVELATGISVALEKEGVYEITVPKEETLSASFAQENTDTINANNVINKEKSLYTINLFIICE